MSPYGVYDLQDNSGWVSVGLSADTSEFAVQTIRRWWYSMGEERYPQAEGLFVAADCGGSNGYRTRLWKLELQRLADELKLPITVEHFRSLDTNEQNALVSEQVLRWHVYEWEEECTSVTDSRH